MKKIKDFFFKSKLSAKELSKQRPVNFSNLTAESIKRGVHENAQRLKNTELAINKLEEELKHYK